MKTNSQLSKTVSKNDKQLNRNRITEMEITWKVISMEWEGGEWGKTYRG